MNRVRSRRPRTGRTVSLPGEAGTPPPAALEPSRSPRRATYQPPAARFTSAAGGPQESLRPCQTSARWPRRRARRPTSSRRRAPTTGSRSWTAAREADMVPYFRLIESEAGPVVEMEGREKIMLGSNNYLGLTGDERVKGGRPRRARALRHRRSPGRGLINGTIPAAHRARARDRGMDGDRGRDRLHDRLPGQPRHDRDDPRARRHRDLRLRRPRLDPRRLPALRRAAAPLPPQPHGQARADAGARGRRRRRRPRRRRRGLLDGGRHLRPAGVVELCRSHGARLLVDEAHGVGVLGRARRRAAASCSGSRTRSTCGWGPSPRAWPRAAASSPGPADVVEYLRIAARAFLFTAAAVPAAVGAALEAVRICRREGGPLFERLLDNSVYLHRGPQRARAARRRADAAARRQRGDHPDRPGRRRRGLAGGDAVEGAVRGRRLHQRRASPRGPAGRRAAADQPDGDPRARASRPRAGDLRLGPRRGSRTCRGPR